MKTRMILLTAATAAILAGCNNDNEPAAGADGRTALQVSTTVTRATGSAFVKDDHIGHYLMNPLQNTVVGTYGNVDYKANDLLKFNPAAADKTIYLPVDGTACYAVAYYPYQANIGAVGTYQIDLSGQDAMTDLTGIDLMVAPMVTGLTKDNATANFTFAHKLNRLQLNLEAGAGLTAEDLAGIKVTLTNRYLSGACDVLTDGEAVVSVAETNDVVTNDLPMSVSADGKTAKALQFPMEADPECKLIFTLADGEVFTSSLATKVFEAGVQDIYTVTVQRTALGINAIITPWTDQTTPGGITAD